jgi:hypothetical protein
MDHSNFRLRNETINIYSYNVPNLSSHSLEIFEFPNSGNALLNITPTIHPGDISEISPGLYTFSYTLPDKDCNVLIIFNNKMTHVRVGNASTVFTLWAPHLTSVSYKMIFPDGNIQQQGSLINFPDTNIWYFLPNVLGECVVLLNNSIPVKFRVPYLSTQEPGSNIVTSVRLYLQKSSHVLAAIPKKGGRIYQDFIQVIEQKYGNPGSTYFNVLNAYPNTHLQNNEFLSFIPGVTNTSLQNKANFELVYTDQDGSDEIAGFWISTKNYPGDVITFEWSGE